MNFEVGILQAMMSADSAHRGAGETAYNKILAESPDTLTQGLLNCLPTGAQSDSIRIMAGVMLRQLLDPKRGHWANMSPPVSNLPSYLKFLSRNTSRSCA
jgi:hypothetical protein